jgi:hypothetical protein
MERWLENNPNADALRGLPRGLESGPPTRISSPPSSSSSTPILPPHPVLLWGCRDAICTHPNIDRRVLVYPHLPVSLPAVAAVEPQVHHLPLCSVEAVSSVAAVHHTQLDRRLGCRKVQIAPRTDFLSLDEAHHYLKRRATKEGGLGWGLGRGGGR